MKVWGGLGWSCALAVLLTACSNDPRAKTAGSRDAGRADAKADDAPADEDAGADDASTERDDFVLDVDVVESRNGIQPVEGAFVRVDDTHGNSLEKLTDEHGRARFVVDANSKPWTITAAK